MVWFQVGCQLKNGPDSSLLLHSCRNNDLQPDDYARMCGAVAGHTTLTAIDDFEWSSAVLVGGAFELSLATLLRAGGLCGVAALGALLPRSAASLASLDLR